MTVAIKPEHVAAAVKMAWTLAENASKPADALAHFAQAIADAEQRGYERGMVDAKTLDKLGAA